MMKKILTATVFTAASALAANADSHGVNSPIGMLPQAEAGQCFARIVTPAKYKITPETVVVKEGYEKLEAMDAVFAPSSTEVMVKEEGVRYIIRQPRYEARTEQVMVKPGYERLVIEPAQFETVTETIVVSKARKVWKPGANLSNTQRVDKRTGQVYCLVEIPAKTKTVTRRVLVSPEQVKRVAVDARYKEYTKQVMVDRGGVDEVVVPAEYSTIKTQELVNPARAERVHVAAKTSTVDRKELVAPERFDWVEVLCETNATPSAVSDMQSILKEKGYYKGPVDGILGPMTQGAIEKFQKDNGIPHNGYVTMETLSALGLYSAAPVVEHKMKHVERQAYTAPTIEEKAYMTPAVETSHDITVVEQVDMHVSSQNDPVLPPHREDGIYKTQSGVMYPMSGLGQMDRTYQEELEQEVQQEYSVRRRRLNWDGK